MAVSDPARDLPGACLVGHRSFPSGDSALSPFGSERQRPSERRSEDTDTTSIALVTV